MYYQNKTTKKEERKNGEKNENLKMFHKPNIKSILM